MKIKEFTYEKKDYNKDYSLLVLNEDSNYLKGISLNDLTEEEYVNLLEIQEEYEDRLEPFMKHFKQFKKEKIIREEG